MIYINNQAYNAYHPPFGHRNSGIPQYIAQPMPQSSVGYYMREEDVNCLAPCWNSILKETPYIFREGGMFCRMIVCFGALGIGWGLGGAAAVAVGEDLGSGELSGGCMCLAGMGAGVAGAIGANLTGVCGESVQEERKSRVRQMIYTAIPITMFLSGALCNACLLSSCSASNLSAAVAFKVAGIATGFNIGAAGLCAACIECICNPAEERRPLLNVRPAPIPPIKGELIQPAPNSLPMSREP